MKKSSYLSERVYDAIPSEIHIIFIVGIIILNLAFQIHC